MSIEQMSGSPKSIAFTTPKGDYVVSIAICRDVFFIEANRDGVTVGLNQAIEASPNAVRDKIELFASVDRCRLDGTPAFHMGHSDSDTEFKRNLIVNLAQAASSERISELLRGAAPVLLIEDCIDRIAKSVAVLTDSEWRRTAIAETEDLVDSAQAAAEALESNFSLTEGAKFAE